MTYREIVMSTKLATRMSGILRQGDRDRRGRFRRRCGTLVQSTPWIQGLGGLSLLPRQDLAEGDKIEQRAQPRRASGTTLTGRVGRNARTTGETDA
jgi:hypothetical protein